MIYAEMNVQIDCYIGWSFIRLFNSGYRLWSAQAVCLRTTQKVPESIAKTMFYFVDVCIFVLHRQDEIVCHYVHMQYCII